MLQQPTQLRRSHSAGIFHILPVSRAIGITLGLALFSLAAMPVAAAPPIGINLSNDTLFVDVMKNSTSGGWYDFGPGQTPPLPPNPNFGVDSNGWPTSDVGINYWDWRVNMSWDGPDPNAVARDVSGVYKLSFNGIATVVPGGSSFTITNQVYNSGTNTTTADLTIPAGESTLFVKFINTQRTQTSAVNTGFTNVHMIRPGYPTTNGLPNAGTPTFTNYYTRTTDIAGTPALLKDFSSMRCMGLLAINSDKASYHAGGDAQLPSYYILNSNPKVVNPNRFIQWSGRHLPSNAIQDNTGNYYGYSWEYLVQLANLVNKDLWINIPTGASDDYVTKVAQLLKYGSDGVNPYTSTQGSPVWAPLNSNLHFYVEYSNEVWNYTLSGAFFYVTDMSNDPNMPAAAQGWVGNAYAYRCMQISNDFKGVYGAGAMNTTVRPLVAWQAGQIEQVNAELQMIAGNYGAPSQFFYGVASAPYFDEGPNNDAADLTTMFTFLNNDINTVVFHQASQTTAIAKYWGLKSLCYEGGVGLTGWTTANELLMDDANRDSRMGTAITNYLNTLYGAAGVDLFHQLALVSIAKPRFGFWEIYEDPSKPMVKSAAFDAFAAAPAPALTAGINLPTSTGSPLTIATGASTMNQNGAYGSGSGSSGIGGSGSYIMYLAHNTTSSTTTYTVSLNSGECCPNSTKMYEILVDNVLVSGPFQIPANGANSTPATFTAGPGLHTIEVAGTGTSGSTINFLTVNYISSVSGGSLSGTVGTPTASPINLTTEGVSDWADWGAESGTSYDHKATGGAQISNLTAVGGATLTFDSNYDHKTSWTDGTPTVSAANNDNGITANNTSGGMSFTAPADTATRTLRVYVDVWAVESGKLTAHLSDGSAADYVDTSLVSTTSPTLALVHVYTITYKAASANQTLTVTWTHNTGTSYLDIMAATLTKGSLTGTVGTPSSNPINLTTEGTRDWADWGAESGTSYDHKATGGGQISNLTAVGGATLTFDSNYDHKTSWTDGTPTVSAANNNNGITANNTSGGMSFTAPADTTTRTLRVYVDVWAVESGKLTAHLSDGSASDYVDTSLVSTTSPTLALVNVYTLTYRAASANQTLTVTWTHNTGTSYLDVLGATLQ